MPSFEPKTYEQMRSRNTLLFHLTRVVIEDQNVNIFLENNALGQDSLDKLYKQRHALLSLQFLSGIPDETFLEMDVLSQKWKEVLKKIIGMCDGKLSSYEDICQSIAENIKAFDTNIYERHSDFFNFYLSPKYFFKSTQLKIRLQECFKENNIAMIANIVITELPWKVLHLPRREWENLLEWIFTRVEIDGFLVQMAGFNTNSDWSAQIEDVLTRIGANTQAYCVENVICFLDLARTYKKYHVLERNSTHYRDYWTFYEITYKMHDRKAYCSIMLTHHSSLCLPSGEVQIFRISDSLLRCDLIEVEFLFDETIRVAREAKKRKDAMIAVTMAMHDRLGKDSAMRVLGAEMVNMIFCML